MEKSCPADVWHWWERGLPFELGRQDGISKITVAAMAVWAGVSAGIFLSFRYFNACLSLCVCFFGSGSPFSADTPIAESIFHAEPLPFPLLQANIPKKVTWYAAASIGRVCLTAGTTTPLRIKKQPLCRNAFLPYKKDFLLSPAVWYAGTGFLLQI